MDCFLVLVPRIIAKLKVHGMYLSVGSLMHRHYYTHTAIGYDSITPNESITNEVTNNQSPPFKRKTKMFAGLLRRTIERQLQIIVLPSGTFCESCSFQKAIFKT